MSCKQLCYRHCYINNQPDETSPCHPLRNRSLTQTRKMRHVFLIIISISRTEHQAHLKCLRLHLFLSLFLLHHFPSNHFYSRKIHIKCFMVTVPASQSSDRTSLSAVVSTAGEGRTSSLFKQDTAVTKTKLKKDEICFLCYWLSLPARPWTGRVTTATVRGTLALYSYLATAFSPPVKVISRMANTFVRATHTHTQMHVWMPYTFLKTGKHLFCSASKYITPCKCNVFFHVLPSLLYRMFYVFQSTGWFVWCGATMCSLNFDFQTETSFAQNFHPTFWIAKGPQTCRKM